MALACLFWVCLRIRPRIIQAAEPDSWLVAWLCARLYGGSVVFDVHEMFPAYLAGKLPVRFTRRGEAWLLRASRWLLGRADAVFHVSDDRRTYYGVPGDNQFVVPSYPRLAIAEIRPTSSVIDVVHLGKIPEPACRRVLLEALARCRAAGQSIGVAIIGQGRQEFADGMSAADLRNADGCFQCYDTLPHGEALALAAGARLGLALYDQRTASRNIVASRKLFEYMALGLPVVGSDVAGISDLITRHDLGTAVPLESAALADALLDLLNDTKRRVRCAENGRAAFRTHYNWESQSAWLMGVYAALANRSRCVA
jgi:glycosyltransferase involved in cell wall biosynthesis